MGDRNASGRAADEVAPAPAGGLLASAGIHLGQPQNGDGHRGPDLLPAARLRGPVIPWEAIHPVPIRVPPITVNGTYDFPDLLGPHDPYWWDVRRLGAWGFTAGTVTLNLNSVFGEQLASQTAAGNFTWGTSLLLAPRDHLVVTVTGLTGSVTMQGQAFEIGTLWLPDYLL